MSIARTGFHRLRSVRLDDASPDPYWLDRLGLGFDS
jgi:hypothetical protein